jgi:hypothetical protein
MPVTSGSIQICRKWVTPAFSWLNSLWRTPLPALMRCTSPGTMVEPVPIESLWPSAPSST